MVFVGLQPEWPTYRKAPSTLAGAVSQVQAGVGRTGQWWGHQNFEPIVPDIMLFAKGIASGYPFAGMAARPELYESLKPGSMGAPQTLLSGFQPSCNKNLQGLTSNEGGNQISKGFWFPYNRWSPSMGIRLGQ